MANPYNTVTLTGRLTKDPVLKQTNGANPLDYCQFNIAVSRQLTKKQRDEVKANPNSGIQEADFFLCSAWGEIAKTINQYFSKGKPITIIGSIQSYTKDDGKGNKTSGSSIKVDSFAFALSDNTSNTSNSNNQTSKPANPPTAHYIAEDDDLPF